MKKNSSTKSTSTCLQRNTRTNGEYLSRMYYNDLNKTTGMFSIPDRLLCHGKNTKPIKSGRTPKAKKKCGNYTEIRREREEFRKTLVALIFSTFETDDHNNDFPNSGERETLKYYHFIRQGMDIVNVAPMHQKIIFNCR